MTFLKIPYNILFLIPIVIGCHQSEMTEAELDAKIDKLRKGDFEVQLSIGGKSITGEATYELIRHDFHFGTCVDDRALLEDSIDGGKYRDILTKYFNYAVGRFRMKWAYMEPESGVHADTIPLLNFKKCAELGIPMRGHCIFWGSKNRPVWTSKLDDYELRKALETRAKHVLTLFKGKISEWDCNNEMIDGDSFQRAVPNQAEYFKICKRVVPNIILYVNEHSIFTNRRKRRIKYIDLIKQLLKDGAEVGGIGCQGHFGRVPSVESLWNTLNELAQLGLPIKITEFDVMKSQAYGLRRFYKTCFAHPAVNGILMWGFWAGLHWRPEAGLWAENWSIRPHGKEYVKLITEEWVSRGTVQASPDGTIRFRGFFGTYKIKAGGKIIIRKFSKKDAI